jgi:hypothetical protein
MFDMDPNKPFLDCYMIEVIQWPKYGPDLEHYAIADIYHYNSLEDSLENKKQSPYIQIPEYFVRNFDKKLLNDLQNIIDKPIIKRINDELWDIDYDR